LEQEIRKAGGVPQMIPTGHVYFKHAMQADTSILLGGEVSSHTFIRDNFYGFDDGLYASLRVLELLSRTDKPLSKMFESIPKTYTTEEIKLHTPDEHKFMVINGIKRSLQESWEIIAIDGVRVKFSDSAWALVRASNTSSNITLRFEAESQAKLKEIMQIIKSRLEEYPVVDSTQLIELL
ncbi:phosphomannomutase, partial [candidate division WWE3 bacterium]|nr:phosphomannomutase [candidate division WWE3 bacterium]